MFMFQYYSENMSAQEQRVTIWRKPNTINIAVYDNKGRNVNTILRFLIVSFIWSCAIVQLLGKTQLKPKLDLDWLTKQITSTNHNVSKIPH